MTFFTLLYATVGGALGTFFRALAIKYFKFSSLFSILPLPTLIVNVIGSFLAGIFFYKLSSKNELYAFLSIGFCGGMTTMSTCVLESFLLIERGNTAFGIINATVNLIASIIAVALGFKLSKGM
jgi:CrcB protein